MREIKFRAWDKISKHMLYSHEPAEQNKREYIMVQFGIGFSNWERDDLEIMQYIGLKDKAGKKIYEGDILGIEDATAKVVFWERPPHFGLDFYHNEAKWCEDWNLTDDSTRMEIIGNIYANPELLEAH